MSIAEKLTTIAENEPKVFEAGQKSEYDRFWDSYQDYGRKRTYQMAFCHYGWTNETFKPKYDIICEGGYTANQIFNNSRIKDILVTVDVSKATTVLTSMLSGCQELKTIKKLVLSRANIFNNTFGNCPKLENITIEGEIGQDGVNFQQSTLLTHESLMSIINALVDYSGTSTWKTITLGPTNLAKLTADELATMTSKQWEYI